MPRRKAPETVDPDQEAPRAAAAGARRGPGAEPAGAPHRRPQPGRHDRPGHEHLPGRHRRDRGHRPRTRRRRAPRRHRRLRRRSHPLDRLHPHPPRPLAGRGRAQGAHRRRGAGLGRRATASRSTASSRHGALHRGDRVPPAGHAHAGPCVEPPLLPARRGAHALLGRPHHAGLDRRDQPARRQHGRVPRVAGRGAGLRLRSIAPGHGHLIEEPRRRHRRRTSSTARPASSRSYDLLAASGTTKIDDLVEVIYVDVDPELHPVASRTVHAHLIKLAKEGKVKGRSIDGKWISTDPPTSTHRSRR